MVRFKQNQSKIDFGMSLTPTDLKIIGVTEHDLIQALESVEQEMTVDEPAYDPM